jgi:hypothetical protein
MKIDRDAVVLSQGDNNRAANTAFAHENNSRQQLCGKTRFLKHNPAPRMDSPPV